VTNRTRISKPTFDEQELEALRQTLESGWVGRGPRTTELEKRFADYIGVKHAIALNSCTAALHLAMIAAEVEGQEVLTTSMTFVSTNHAILHGGGRPVFCDIEPDTLNINPEEIARKITPTTRAIVVVHYGGHACNMDPILELAQENRLWVIEDTAQGCGGLYKDRFLGSMGHIGCFSFQATKNMTTGDGGMLTTNDDALAERVRKLRWVGISKPTWERFRPGQVNRSWMYEVEEVGFKYEMNDLDAALGLVQLDKLEANNSKRRALLDRYRHAFEGFDGVEFLANHDYTVSSSYNAVIKVDADMRDDLYQHLESNGIDSNVHYYPNHLLRLYRVYTTRLPVTEQEWQRILTIPLYPDMSHEDQDFITECIKEYVAGCASDRSAAGAL
jgi:perosamine synthetase